MKNHAFDNSQLNKTALSLDFKHLCKHLTKRFLRPRKEITTPVNKVNRNLEKMSYEELSAVFFFEATVLLGKASVPENSETAQKIYAEAPWDMIIWAAKKEGFPGLAEQLETMFRTWLSLPVGNTATIIS